MFVVGSCKRGGVARGEECVWTGRSRAEISRFFSLFYVEGKGDPMRSAKMASKSEKRVSNETKGGNQRKSKSENESKRRNRTQTSTNARKSPEKEG